MKPTGSAPMNHLHNCEHCSHLKLRFDGICPECGAHQPSRWRRMKATLLPTLLGYASVLLNVWGVVPLAGFFRFGTDPVSESAVRCIAYLSPMLIAIGLGLYAIRRGGLATRVLGVVGVLLAISFILNFVVWVVGRR